MSYDNIPIELRSLPRWVCWKMVHDAEHDKMRKVPINPHTGGSASCEDSSTWSDYETAVNAVSLHSLSGIGFQLGEGIVGIDIDHCVDTSTGEVDDTAADILSTIPSYAEYSVSGTGVHIIARGSLPAGGRRKGAVEMYESGRYFTVSGEPVGDILRPISEATEAMADVHRRYIGGITDASPARSNALSVSLDDTDVLSKMYAAKGGADLRDLYAGAWQGKYDSQSSADIALCNALAFWCERDTAQMDRLFRASGLYRPKWDEKRGKETYGAMTLRKAADSCRQVYERPQQEGSPPTVGETTEDAPESKGYSLDDTGNARRFRDTYEGQVMFDVINRVWRVWDGKRWASDRDGDVKRKADALLDKMRAELDMIPDDDEHKDLRKALKQHIARSRSSKGKDAMLKEAQHLHKIPCSPDLFDVHTGALNVQNGILNLVTGKLLPHHPLGYHSRLAGADYDPLAKSPVWEAFLLAVFCGDVELIEYIRRAVGYSLTGDVREQCMFLCVGDGSNGKSTFLEIIAKIMGEYAANVQAETIMRKRTGGASSDVARLDGARLVTMQEPDKDAALNEPLVKQITGSGTVTARFLYANEFEYEPHYKLWLATNYKPRVKGTDEGIWRRIRVIPFAAHFEGEKKDMTMKAKLLKELPGILNWCLEGAKQWAEAARHGKSGLPPCKVVDDATLAYRAEMDRMGTFLDECICESPGETLQAYAMYKAYQGWCAENGERYPLTSQAFGREMTQRYSKRHTRSGAEYIGLGLTMVGQVYAIGKQPDNYEYNN